MVIFYNYVEIILINQDQLNFQQYFLKQRTTNLSFYYVKEIFYLMILLLK